MILAGGAGKRLAPLTDDCPKPLLPIMNKPLLEITLKNARRVFSNVTLAIGYKSDKIIKWADYAHISGVKFIIEETPLGTLGAVKRAIGYNNEPTVVISGDGFCDINYRALIEFHARNKADATIVTVPSARPELYGVVSTQGDTITAFSEKPPRAIAGVHVNCGIYVINSPLLHLVEKRECDFSRDLFPRLIVQGYKLCAYRHDGYWRDIGDMQSYYNANFDFRNQDNGGATHISATVSGKAVECIIGANACVSETASIEKCLVMPDTFVSGEHYREIISPKGAFKVSEDFALSSGLYQHRASV